MNIHVTNLGSKITEESLHAAFSAHGKVASAELVYDLFTGAPRGFAYVDMPDEAEAQKAITSMHGAVVDGQSLQVKPAAPKPSQQGSYRVKTSRDFS